MAVIVYKLQISNINSLFDYDASHSDDWRNVAKQSYCTVKVPLVARVNIWLQEQNIKTINSYFVKDRQHTNHCVIVFHSESDALLFKMRWL